MWTLILLSHPSQIEKKASGHSWIKKKPKSKNYPNQCGTLNPWLIYIMHILISSGQANDWNGLPPVRFSQTETLPTSHTSRGLCENESLFLWFKAFFINWNKFPTSCGHLSVGCKFITELRIPGMTSGVQPAVVSCFKPSRQLSTTQPFTHRPPAGWGGELEG